MKKLFNHIETLQGKPHHIRRRIAIGSATFASALIALIWLVGSLVTGAFAIKQSSFADVSTGAATLTTTRTGEDTGASPVAGVGAASIIQTDTTKPHIQIIDTSGSSTSKKQPEQTVIPF
jgi:hypothetical protein